MTRYAIRTHAWETLRRQHPELADSDRRGWLVVEEMDGKAWITKEAGPMLAVPVGALVALKQDAA